MIMADALEKWTPIAEVYHPLTCGSIDGTDDYPHDKAVLRALASSYKPNKQVDGDPLCTIFVGRLNPDTIEEALLQVFSEYGSIKRLRLVRDIISGFSKRYAFIEYKSASSAVKATSRANKMRLDDREILVDMECERELKGWIPRRLGGGFGGKKESGQLRFGGKDRPFRKPIVLNQFTQPATADPASRRNTWYPKSQNSRGEGSRGADYHRESEYGGMRRPRADSRHCTGYKNEITETHGGRRYANERRERSPSPGKKSKARKRKRYSRSRSRERMRSRSRSRDRKRSRSRSRDKKRSRDQRRSRRD